ncbi:MAG: prolipoprotein diacylglyceryl transferase [Myxococcales bacterium]|nr:prolipoprotein diacylglyceryl transferase [Myxococcales bacterium]
MRPILFEIGGIEFPSYFTLLTVGYAIALVLALRQAKKVGVDRDDMLDLGLYMLFAGLIGSRLLHVLADGYFWDYVHLCTDPLKVDVPSFIHVKCDSDAACVAADAGALCHPINGRCHPAKDCLAALAFWQGGLAFLGGFIACLPVGIWFIRRRKMSFWKVADLAAFGIPFGLIFGRMGCFLSGCCYGAQHDGPLSLRFGGYLARLGPDATCPPHYLRINTPDGMACAFGRPAFLDHAKHGLLSPGADLSLPVYATQIWSALLALGIFLWIYFYRRRHPGYAGKAFFEFIVLYGVGRFIIEFFRADDRGLWFGDLLSTSQILALPLVAWAGWLWWKRRAAPPTEAS